MDFHGNTQQNVPVAFLGSISRIGINESVNLNRSFVCNRIKISQFSSMLTLKSRENRRGRFSQIVCEAGGNHFLPSLLFSSAAGFTAFQFLNRKYDMESQSLIDILIGNKNSTELGYSKTLSSIAADSVLDTALMVAGVLKTSSAETSNPFAHRFTSLHERICDGMSTSSVKASAKNAPLKLRKSIRVMMDRVLATDDPLLTHFKWVLIADEDCLRRYFEISPSLNSVLLETLKREGIGGKNSESHRVLSFCCNQFSRVLQEMDHICHKFDALPISRTQHLIEQISMATLKLIADPAQQEHATAEVSRKGSSNQHVHMDFEDETMREEVDESLIMQSSIRIKKENRRLISVSGEEQSEMAKVVVVLCGVMRARLYVVGQEAQTRVFQRVRKCVMESVVCELDSILGAAINGKKRPLEERVTLRKLRQNLRRHASRRAIQRDVRYQNLLQFCLAHADAAQIVLKRKRHDGISELNEIPVVSEMIAELLDARHVSKMLHEVTVEVARDDLIENESKEVIPVAIKTKSKPVSNTPSYSQAYKSNNSQANDSMQQVIDVNKHQETTPAAARASRLSQFRHGLFSFGV
mmetsp:Transcript_9451/g.17058  ORF Transcript_9451/g.17058 Transcript_9451/m.17058 type:complete len:583 (-) Transcript_9451:2751-4499(-)